MARRRKPGLLGVMLLGAFYYFVPLPVGYLLASDSLRCPHFEACPGRRKPTQLQAARTAVMLYMADNPRNRKCPTVEALVEERYLGEWHADGIEISCGEGDVEVFGPPAPPPPPVPPVSFSTMFGRVACGLLAVGVEIWLVPIRAFGWSWKTAAGWFV